MSEVPKGTPALTPRQQEAANMQSVGRQFVRMANETEQWRNTAEEVIERHNAYFATSQAEIKRLQGLLDEAGIDYAPAGGDTSKDAPKTPTTTKKRSSKRR